MISEAFAGSNCNFITNKRENSQKKLLQKYYVFQIRKQLTQIFINAQNIY